MSRDTPRQGQKEGQGHKRKAPRVRLGSGNFVLAAAPNPFAQSRYLHAVSRCVPKAIRELAAFRPTRLPTGMDREGTLRLLAENKKWLQDWAVTYGFTDEWALETALRNAARWRKDPATQGSWIVSGGAWEPPFGQVPERTPERIAHLYALREAYAAEILQILERGSTRLLAGDRIGTADSSAVTSDHNLYYELAVYVRWIDAELASPTPRWLASPPVWDPMSSETEDAVDKRWAAYKAALKSAPGIKRTDEKEADERHYEWLALRHAGKWKLAKIAERYGGRAGIEIGSVSEAIKSTADLVGLTLRRNL
jgi:nucleotide-binding universal stress UspA family protein